MSSTTAAPATSPYYLPANEGNSLVPIPNGAASPARISPSPVPADNRPQLDPNRAGINPGSEAFVSPTLDEVFVSTSNSDEAAVELVAPQLSPAIGDTPPSESDETRNAPAVLSEPTLKTATAIKSTSQLVPISWNVPAEQQRSAIPTDRVWDDSGWTSQQ